MTSYWQKNRKASTVSSYFRTGTQDWGWEKIHQALREQGRTEDGRASEPSAAIVDSQSIKITEIGGARGYDMGKQVKGRQRHILVDTLGLVMRVVVTKASVQDRDGDENALRTRQTAIHALTAHLGRWGRCLHVN